MLVFWFSWGIGVEVGRGQSSAAPAYKATFSWSLALDATVVRASTNTQVTCTVDISLTGDPYQPLPAWVKPVPSIVGAGGSTSISTNFDYSPNWVWVTLYETGETLQPELVVLNPTLTVFAKDDPGVVNHLGGIRSPNTGNVKVSACVDDPTRGGSPTYGGISHHAAGRRHEGTAKLDTWVIIGGKTLPRYFGCFGIAEFIQGTPFDTVTPHIWEATLGDSITTASVIVSLTP